MGGVLPFVTRLWFLVAVCSLASAAFHIAVTSPAADKYGGVAVRYGDNIAVTAEATVDGGAATTVGVLCLSSSSVSNSCSGPQTFPISITWDLMSEVPDRELLDVVLYAATNGGAANDNNELARKRLMVEVSFFDRHSEALVLEEGISPIKTGNGAFNLAVNLALTLGPPDGAFAEFGVYQGASTRSIAAILAPHGRSVHGFDAFRGLPERWRDSFETGSFDIKGVIPENLPENVILHIGWFNATAIAFAEDLSRNGESIAFLHIDCDLYSSTRQVLEALSCHLVSGSVIQFDEYFNYKGWFVDGQMDGEARAWREITDLLSIKFHYLGYIGTAVSVLVTQAPNASCAAILSEVFGAPNSDAVNDETPRVEVVNPPPESVVLVEHGGGDPLIIAVKLSNVRFEDSPALCITTYRAIGASQRSAGTDCTPPGQRGNRHTGNHHTDDETFVFYLPNPTKITGDAEGLAKSTVVGEEGWHIITAAVRVRGNNESVVEPKQWPLFAETSTTFQFIAETPNTKEWRRTLVENGGDVFSTQLELLRHCIELTLHDDEKQRAALVEVSRGETGVNSLAEVVQDHCRPDSKRRVQIYSFLPESQLSPKPRDTNCYMPSRTAAAYSAAFCRACRGDLRQNKMSTSYLQESLQAISARAKQNAERFVINLAVNGNASFLVDFIEGLICATAPGSIVILQNFLADEDLYTPEANAWIDLAKAYDVKWEPIASMGRAVAMNITRKAVYCQVSPSEPQPSHKASSSVPAMINTTEVLANARLAAKLLPTFRVFATSNSTTLTHRLRWPAIRRLWFSQFEYGPTMLNLGTIISSLAHAAETHVNHQALRSKSALEQCSAIEAASTLLVGIGKVLYLALTNDWLHAWTAQEVNKRAHDALEMALQLSFLPGCSDVIQKPDLETTYVLAHVKHHGFREWDEAAEQYQTYAENMNNIQFGRKTDYGCRVWPSLFAKEGVWDEGSIPIVTVNPAALPNETAFKVPKLRHDSAQIRYLASSGSTGHSTQILEAVADGYATLADEIDSGTARACDAAITQRSKRVALATATVDSNQILHIAAHRNAHAFGDGPLFGDWNSNAVQAEWDEQAASSASKTAGVAIIDSFLSAAALKALRKFMDDSTIWGSTPHGYVGAYVDLGLANGLLLRIADELRDALPHIFKGHRLYYAFAYSYGNGAAQRRANLTKGIAVHADNSAINVNIWLTELEDGELEDDRSIPPRSNGLLIRRAEAPLGSGFSDVNGNSMKIERYLQDRGDFRENATFVPYRGNRCILFGSRLFHETAPLHWPTEAWSRRRINLTLLFGLPSFG